MRRPLRLVDDTACVLDVDVVATPDATVGDLADALAAHVAAHDVRGADAVDGANAVDGADGADGAEALTVVSRWPLDERSAPPPRAAPLATHGPRAGSSVRLVPAVDAVGDTTAPAPVRLRGSGGDDLRLAYGPNRLGDAVVEVADQVTVRAVGASGARLGGAAVLGAERLAPGDLLTVSGVPRTVLVDGPLQPPAPKGWARPHPRRPVPTLVDEPVTVTLPTPPPSSRTPGFPVLSATVPLLMAVALWIATGSWLAAGFMLFSVVFVVASGLEARREARAEDRARVAEFRADLHEVEAQLDALADRQRARHEQMGRTPAQVRALVRPGEDRPDPALWQRQGPRPSMTVRLGTGIRRFEGRIVVPDTGRRELRHELDRVAASRSSTDDVVTVDLACTGGLVIEGADELAAAVARSVVLQLASLIGPDLLGIAVVTSSDRSHRWRDVRWLPHRSTDRRARWLVVADGAAPAALRSSLDQLGTDDATVLWVAPPDGPRPAEVGAVLQVVGERARLRLDLPGAPTELIDQVRLEPMQPEESEPVARCLAGHRPAPEARWRRTDGAEPAGGAPGGSVRLRDVLAEPALLDDAPTVAGRWSAPDPGHLATPLGLDGHGAVVNVDLRHDGPHALIAGTTGAGKSELLRTLLVSAALHHSPERLHLLLIDYKGGAAFGPLSRLPHAVGTITDLSGDLARRGLVSLRAELRRREAVVAEHGSDRWTGSALVVVVDELATLVSELPDFVEGLVDLAQRGRSLGIHLVLATQRPAGVVTDAIRANVTMRLSLRVADEDDSRDVVGTPDAAHLPRDLPGRAVVRLDPTRTTTVQVAYSGAPPGDAAAVRVETWAPDVDLAPGSGAVARPSVGPDGPPTELELAVATVAAAAQLAELAPARRPWLDPLPPVVAADGLTGPTHPGALVIGTIDRPDRTSRVPLQIDLARDGGLVVLGASGAGASTAVRTIAVAAEHDPGQRWHVHVVDQTGALDDLRRLHAVGDVVGVQDTERVLRLLRRTVAAIDAGAPAPDAPRRLLVIDGIAAMEERYERIDRGEAMDLVARIARDGRAAGVHLVVTARRRAEVPVAVAGALSGRLLLRCSTHDEAAVLGLDEAATDPDLPPGRCWSGGFVGQVALAEVAPRPDRGVDERRCGPAAPVPRLPTLVRVAELSPQPDPEGRIALGLDADALRTTHLDLRHHHGIVAGPPRSGVSTTLRTLVGRHPDARLVGRGDADDLGTAVRWAIATAAAGRPSLLALDDAADVLDGPEGDGAAALLAELVDAARDHPVRLVLGGEVDALARCYHDVLASVRRGRTGVLLGGDPELHGALWHAALPTRSDLPAAPGRGWLLGPSVASRVQVAVD